MNLFGLNGLKKVLKNFHVGFQYEDGRIHQPILVNSSKRPSQVKQLITVSNNLNDSEKFVLKSI